MKIENRSRKQSHKLNGIGVGRIRTFPFLPIPFTTPSLMIQWKLGYRSRKQKRKNQPIAKPRIEHCHWFILLLLLRQCSFHLIVSDGDISRISVLHPTPSVWFFLLIKTPTTTPSLVKTSLYQYQTCDSTTGSNYNKARSNWQIQGHYSPVLPTDLLQDCKSDKTKSRVQCNNKLGLGLGFSRPHFSVIWLSLMYILYFLLRLILPCDQSLLRSS